MAFIDYYKLLGIDPVNSTQEQIVEAIQRKRIEVKGSPELEQRVNNAELMLTNPENRLVYNIDRFCTLEGEAVSQSVVMSVDRLLKQAEDVSRIPGEPSNPETHKKVEISREDYEVK